MLSLHDLKAFAEINAALAKSPLTPADGAHLHPESDRAAAELLAELMSPQGPGKRMRRGQAPGPVPMVVWSLALMGMRRG